MDELFAGAPSLTVVKMLLHKVAMRKGELGVMALGVTRAFLYGMMKRRVYIELPDLDPESKNKGEMGRLVNATYGARDAPLVGGAARRND